MKIFKRIVLILFPAFLVSNICICEEKDKTQGRITVETPYFGDYLYTYPPYPVPTRGKVNVKVYWDPKYSFVKENINIYDVNGTKVSSKDRIEIEKQSNWYGILSWDATSYQTGIYMIQIKHGSASKTVKVIVL